MDLISMAKKIDPDVDLVDFQRQLDRIEVGLHPYKDNWTPPAGYHKGRGKVVLFLAIAGKRLYKVDGLYPSHYLPVFTKEEIREHIKGKGNSRARSCEASMMVLHSVKILSPQYKAEEKRVKALIDQIRAELDPEDEDD